MTWEIFSSKIAEVGNEEVFPDNLEEGKGDLLPYKKIFTGQKYVLFLTIQN